LGSLVYITLDANASALARTSGAEVVLLDRLKLTDSDRYRMKLIVSYILVRSGIECYVMDSDIIFFGSFSIIWKFNADLEFQSDDQYRVRIRDLPDHLETNSGFGRYSSCLAVTSFLAAVFDFAAVHRELWHQKLLNYFLREGRRLSRQCWVLYGSSGWKVTFSYIEPFKVPNGGLLLCKGRSQLCSFCQNHRITSPVAIHLNFHMPETAKEITLKTLGLNASQGRCPIPFTWSFWKTCNWPVSLQCNGWFINRT
jgi:hypothetical protein